MDLTPFVEGANAASLGFSESVNPYQEGSEEYSEWLKGWNATLVCIM